MSKIEYDPSGKLNSSFQIGAEILNLLLLYADLLLLYVFKLANAIFLLGSLRVSLSANVNLNLWVHMSYYFQCSWRLFPFLNSIDQTIIDCFGWLFFLNDTKNIIVALFHF